MNRISGKNLFFLGKGGTGKTTLASVTALALAERGLKVVLFSLDPAHNLLDIFQIKSSKTSVKLRENLVLEEIETDLWIKTYLRSIENNIARSYKHLTALSLEKHIETIRFSPGLEEYALLYAFEAMIKKYNNFHIRLFDLPPTALALRFFNLSKLTMIWLEQLIDLRKEILKKKKIISDVYQKRSRESEDNVLKQLKLMKKANQDNIEKFQNAEVTDVYIVSNEDQLSLSESTNIKEIINKNGFHLAGMLVNKFQNHIQEVDLQKKFSDTDIHFFNFTTTPLIGINALKYFLKAPSIQAYIDAVLKSVS